MKYFILAFACIVFSNACKKGTATIVDQNTLPTLSTYAVTFPSASRASSGGHIITPGGSSIIDKGVCWSINHNPTISDDHLNDGSGIADFATDIIGISCSTTYYVRAYARTDFGTAYGDEQTFTSLAISGVGIGSQTWMSEDLNVEKYRNGDVIPQVQNSSQWATLTTGAWCYYEPTAGEVDYNRGKLYNWYAVTDPRGLAPTGWHVPSDAEYTVLTNFLGGDVVAGGKMKFNAIWEFPNLGATAASLFNAFPGGLRADNATFLQIGMVGDWWSATASSSTDAWYRGLFYSSTAVTRGTIKKLNGFSVRCIHD